MYNPTQNGTAYHDYPYDPRTHTFASPGGFHYPAPSSQYPPQLAHVTNGHFYQQEVGPQTSNVPGVGHGFAPHFQRYGPGDWESDPRAALGISTLGHSDLPSHHLPYRPPHTSYHLPDHRLELSAAPHRAVTLDSSSTRHHGPTPPFSRSPIHLQSANQTRTASPLSSRSSQRKPLHADWKEPPRPRPRVGGPPKAPLGGIGGKPWDERATNDRSVSTPLPISDSHTPLKTRQAILEGEEPEPTFKGSPIVFKPPPATYSPEDSPETPTAELTIEGREESLEGNSVKVSRKEAFPWPVQPPRGPAVAIPLPPSPVEADPEKGGRRTWTSIASTAIMEPTDGALIKGKRKEVVLAIPNETEWKSQSSMTGLSSAKKQQLWEAVYLRLEPPAPVISASEDTPAVTNDEEQKATTTERPSTPPPHEPPSDVLDNHRSPPTPTRRGQSNAPSAGSAFVRRQLGGMLRSGPSNRSARTRTSTTSIPESSEGTIGEGAEDQIGLGGSWSDNQGVHKGRTQDGEVFSGKEDADLKRGGKLSIDKIPAHPSSEQNYTGPSQEPIAKSINREDEDTVRPTKRTQKQEHIKDERRDDEETTRPSIMRKHSDAESTTPSAKKLRPTAQAWEPRSRASTSTSNADIRPVPRLCPTAHAFTPSFSRIPSANSYVPTGAGQFTFQSNSGSVTHIKRDSRAQSIDAGSHEPETPSAIDMSPSGDDQLQGSDDQGGGDSGRSQDYRSQEDHDIKDDHTSGVSSLSELPNNIASSQETLPSQNAELESSSDTSDADSDNELDLPTARPFSQHGMEERFAVHQNQQPAPATVHNSPAAEIHGIFAESPNASISDSGLFYRRPRSEVSDTVEVLSDSFDPVSYSYESDSESTYEVSSTAVFFTSTPRGGHHALPIGSASSMSDHSSDEQEEEAPAVTYQDPDPRRRFIEWTFPATNGHRPMPSIYRRHTFDHLASDHYDEDHSDSPVPGIASTFASRVGDLRAHLALAQAQNPDQSGKKEHLRVSSGPSGMLSTKSSAEFPMRSPSRVLAVINDTPGDRTSGDVPPLDAVGAEENRDPVLAASRAGLVDSVEIARLLSEISNQLDRTIEAIETSSKGGKVDISPLAYLLEQQSILISSLANATQQNKGHQNDHLVPLLEGQQAVLNKLSTLEGAQSEATAVLARFDQQQSNVVGDLRSELAQMVAKKEEQLEEIHRLEVELLETRQAQINAENGGMETRRSFEAALSRITTLQSDLQVVQEEKQSLSGEVQSLTIAQQRQASISKKHQIELETKQAELGAEKRRNETLAETIRLQSSELAELRRSTSKFQDTLVDRLSRIEEGVQQSTAGWADHVVLQQHNRMLQGEIDGLKEIRHTANQENHNDHPTSSITSSELDDLRRELDTERALRQKATERAEAADKSLEQEVTTRLHAQAMAQERVRYARTQEAQLQARTKECQRWQTLALTPDRNAYRNYMKTKPESVNLTSGTSTPRVKIKSTETSPGQEDLQTPVVSGSGETPTRVWKGKLGQKITGRGEDGEWISPEPGRVVK